jgi:PAS domain S-box-containing protein
LAAENEIADLKRRLAESEERHRLLYDNSLDGILITTPDGGILAANPAACRIFGRTEEEICREGRNGVMDTSDPRVMKAVEERARTGRIYTEMTLIRGDGTHFIGEVSSTIFKDRDGRLLTSMIVQDITDRKRAEDTLRENEKRLQQAQDLLEAVTQGTDVIIASVDTMYRYTFFNKAYQEEIKRLSGKVIQVGDDMLEIFADMPEQQKVAATEWAVVLGGKSTSKTLEFGDPGHYRRVYQVLHTPIVDAKGEVTGAGEVAYDITPQLQTQEALRESEARFRLVLKHAPVSVTAQDKELRFIWAFNQRTVRSEDVIGKTDSDLFPPEHTAKLIALKRQVLETGTELRDQLWMTSAGQRKYLDIFLEPIRDLAGQITGVGLASVDLTERKLAEEALLKAQVELEERVQARTQELLLSNEQLVREVTERNRVEESLRLANTYNRSLLEASLDPLVTITQDGKIGDVNKATEIVTGHRRDELIGADFHEYFTDPEKARAGYQQVFETGTVRDYELEIRHQDGHITPVFYNASVYRDESGDVIGVFAAARDISERKQSEKQLILLTTALESAANGIFITDRDGNILWSNPALERMTGYNYRELNGQNPRILKSGVHDKAFYQHMWESILSGKVWQSEYTNRRKDGSLYTEEQTITPVRDSDGLISHFIAIKQDITERKRAEMRLEQNNRELLALSQSEHKQRQIAETLRQTSLALTQTLDVDTELRILLEHMSRLIPFDSASAALLGGDGCLMMRVTQGNAQWALPEGDQMAQAIAPIPSDALAVLATSQSLLLSEQNEPLPWSPLPGIKYMHSWLGIPLVTEGKVFGLCSLGKTEPGFYTQEHAQIAEAFVAQASMAVQNAWLFEQVRAGRERLQALSHRLVDIQETERRSIARELHDEAGQALASLMIGLRLLEQDVRDPNATLARAKELRGITESVMEELHRMAINLRPASLDHLGLAAALKQYIETLNERKVVTIEFEALGFENGRLSPAIETSLYRIVQEALTNALLHAQASEIAVILDWRGDCVTVIVEDNGVGFTPEAEANRGRMGLVGMRERAEMLGGTLTVESEIGAGTTIHVEVPRV